MIPVGQLDVETEGDREIMMRRGFHAPRTLVFDAYTKPELLRRWMFGPDGWIFTTCEIDLRVGGRYLYEWRRESGSETLSVTGVFREVVVPERLANTEKFDDDWTGGETLTFVIFEEEDGRTLVTTRIMFASEESRRRAMETNMVGGMEAGYVRLDKMFAERRA